MKIILSILTALLLSFTVFSQKIATASIYNTPGNTVFGEVFDATKASVSAKYPKGTMLRITRVDNEVSLVLKVTDQPAGSDVVELTETAGNLIGLQEGQTAKVKVEVLGSKGKAKSGPKAISVQQAMARINWDTGRTKDGKKVVEIPKSLKAFVEDGTIPVPDDYSPEYVRQ